MPYLYSLVFTNGRAWLNPYYVLGYVGIILTIVVTNASIPKRRDESRLYSSSGW
jgi:hypothetical protein